MVNGFARIIGVAMSFFGRLLNLQPLANKIKQLFDSVRQAITRFIYKIADRIGLGDFLLLRHIKKELETLTPADRNLSPEQLKERKNNQAKAFERSQNEIRSRLGLRHSEKKLEISEFKIKNGKLVGTAKVNPESTVTIDPSGPCPAPTGNTARRRLRRSLGASTVFPANVTTQAHHIVPVELFDTPLGMQLCRWDIDLNSAENGVWLPSCEYDGRVAALHTGGPPGRYRGYIEEQFEGVSSRADALAIIDSIRQDLLSGDLELNRSALPCP